MLLSFGFNRKVLSLRFKLLKTVMANEQSKLEFLETPEGLAHEIEKAKPFFEKNKQLLLGVGGAIVGLAILVVGYNFYTKSQDEEGQNALYPLVYQMESDSLDIALKGKGSQAGLLAVGDDYSASDAGNLANFYAGVASLKQGKYDDAITHLEKFSASDLLVQARAYSLIGDAYAEKGSTEEAISYYKKAADYKPNQYFTPTYLLKLGIAQEKVKKYKEASESYKTIIEKYSTSPEYVSAKKYKAQADELAGE
jgi:tetratricopeptide (TPR) repeat protein